jgi:hypothetical protein
MAVLAITNPVALPASPVPVRTRFELVRLAGLAVSPFTGVGQAQDWAGAVWRAQVQLPPMLRATADAWCAWAALLRGRVNWTQFGDWDRRTPRGTWAAPLVNGAGQTGNTLVVDGMGAGGTAKAGDHFQLGNGLHVIVADATADGGGNATIQFEPALRTTPADNDPLTVTNAKGLFRLDSSSVPWDSDALAVHGISFSATEKL